MNKNDPTLRKLVEGAQQFVRPAVEMTPAEKASYAALDEYEKWRDAELAKARPKTDTSN